MRTALALCLLTASLLATVPMAVAQQGPQPSKHHELLAAEAGVWEATAKVWPSPDAEPVESRGLETCTMLGGFWLTTKYEGDFFGQPFTGHGQTGYDAASGQYVTTWIDSMTPDLFVARGAYDPKTRTLTVEGKGRDAMSGELELMRMQVEYPDHDHKRATMHQADGEGGWTKTMQIDYVRRDK